MKKLFCRSLSGFLLLFQLAYGEELSFQWPDLATGETLHWQLCFDKPVDIVERSTLQPSDQWQLLQQGPERWIYESSYTSVHEYQSFRVEPSGHWDVACSAFRHELNGHNRLYGLTQGLTQDSDFANNDPDFQIGTGALLERSHSGPEIATKVTESYFPGSVSHHPRFKRQLPDFCEPPTEALDESNGNSTTSGVPAWSALTGIATLVIFEIVGCCCTCMYFEKIYNILHCRRGK